MAGDTAGSQTTVGTAITKKESTVNKTMADIVRRERIQSVRRLSLSEEIKEATGAGPSEMNKAVDKEREARKLNMNEARKKIGLQPVTREHIE